MTDIQGGATSEELGSWLTERVAFYLDKPIEKIDRSAELAGYGMDSLYSVAIITEIEDNLGIKVDMMAVWKYPTINDLVEYLHTLLTEKTSQPDAG
ncbi:acyl carrier protein [Streptomyces halobius]|uniref:Acyl carrier protein n=1 Tax=Streptomyces halobius TaxID=2879846 RepID=A0ABY4M5E9_9ACTN|nr:acyl carrier protein [Streptomyces halobius]UQA92493.1 acyl carrier protein [Streptomyces halobius]